MAINFNKVRQGAQPCKMPMVREGARWSPDIIMQQVGCWSTYYIDAYGHGDSKMDSIIVME